MGLIYQAEYKQVYWYIISTGAFTHECAIYENPVSLEKVCIINLGLPNVQFDRQVSNCIISMGYCNCVNGQVYKVYKVFLFRVHTNLSDVLRNFESFYIKD